MPFNLGPVWAPAVMGGLRPSAGCAILRAGNRANQSMSTNPDTPTLTPEQVDLIDAYWRAANYLSVGQIYLFDNPLLKRPLTRADVKHMLLGHWGTTPG